VLLAIAALHAGRGAGKYRRGYGCWSGSHVICSLRSPAPCSGLLRALPHGASVGCGHSQLSKKNYTPPPCRSPQWIYWRALPHMPGQSSAMPDARCQMPDRRKIVRGTWDISSHVPGPVSNTPSNSVSQTKWGGYCDWPLAPGT
jgi:hypothetical protein